MDTWPTYITAVLEYYSYKVIIYDCYRLISEYKIKPSLNSDGKVRLLPRNPIRTLAGEYAICS